MIFNLVSILSDFILKTTVRMFSLIIILLVLIEKYEVTGASPINPITSSVLISGYKPPYSSQTCDQ